MRPKLPQALCGKGPFQLHVPGGGERRGGRSARVGRGGRRAQPVARLHAQPRVARRLAGKEARTSRHGERYAIVALLIFLYILGPWCTSEIFYI